MSGNQGGQITKYKIVFLGDQSAGKTSIINRFIYDNFTGNEQPTVGIDFLSKTINLEDKTLRLQLWDTAGQERFRSLIPSYIRDSHAAIIVYDSTNQNSFQNISDWIEDVKQERGNDVIIFVIGNKIDLVDDRKVQYEEAQQKAQQLGVNFTEVSAKDGTNIPQFFQQLSVMLSGGGSEEQNLSQPKQNTNEQGGQKLNNPSTDEKKQKQKGGCC
ncbi:P-loop containing nucleoside triphosphate hydrolase [Pseudocohnilembus persalinus]|uniref:p-loop containing nucleoside triphosphate hydrolase n=1 Tax=Pseudocohnilembus persalinus TaxID=266149 RepID=A0A0V0QP51_PSEPJ|nr:P-loop containing nucleoside triphosphate hydrolase [Pseudocohnilembus persalinus]|eukprot:KRX04054.1 P-loop containing nucleoside triphosphate hydrolase [Pseudocohnilembus persalinus]